MNELKVFVKEEFGSVRVVMRGGEPWFIASDVAKALGYERPNDAVNTHCKKINKFSYGDLPQGAMPYNIIPESDVYPTRRKTSPFRGRMSRTCHPLRVSICCREIKERVHGQMDD